MTHKLIRGSSKHIMAKMEADSIDLVFTSPPYADLREYKPIKPEEYTEWFKPFAKEILRILKPSGSFVLNINNNTSNGERTLYVFDLVIALTRELGFKYIYDFIYNKRRHLPRGNPDLPTDLFEYVFWFAKTTEPYFDLNAVRVPYKSSKSEQKYNIGRNEGFTHSNYNGKGLVKRQNFWRKNGANPGNVITCFPNFANEPDKEIRHSARMPIDLALYFVKGMCPSNGVVLDPFLGSGTTSVAAKQTRRNSIGIDLHQKYIDISKARIQATKLSDKPIKAVKRLW